MFVVSTRVVWAVAALAFLGVWLHWNFWNYGIYALGFNTTVFLGGVAALLLVKNSEFDWRADIAWLAPLVLVGVSFSLYENPWLKLISFLLLPIAIGVFFSYGQLSNRREVDWGVGLIRVLFLNTLRPLGKLPAAVGLVRATATVFPREKNALARRVLIGVLCLVPLAALVLTLLSSADAVFAGWTENIFGWLLDHLQASLLAKVLLSVLLTIGLLAVCLGWRQTGEAPLKQSGTHAIDDVVAGIVITGILGIYLLFLYLQLEYLLVDSLPVEFAATERLVKSGFWQLFFLSFLNVALFFVLYKNTSTAVQRILQAFIVASGLILLSAGWRMGLYVYWYGLSYEKFFASYTTLYALGLFIALVVASFSLVRRDIVRIVVFSSLWGYSIATVLPVEQIIFHTNQHLAKQADTRVDLYHLSVLSADIFADAKQALQDRTLDEYRWQTWLSSMTTRRCQRPWYESNISLLINCDGVIRYETNEDQDYRTLRGR